MPDEMYLPQWVRHQDAGVLLITSRPGGGKTTMLQEIARHCVKEGDAVSFYDLERVGFKSPVDTGEKDGSLSLEDGNEMQGVKVALARINKPCNVLIIDAVEVLTPDPTGRMKLVEGVTELDKIAKERGALVVIGKQLDRDGGLSPEWKFRSYRLDQEA